MKQWTWALISCLILLFNTGQAQTTKLVKILYSDQVISKLHALDVAIDHGLYFKDKYWLFHLTDDEISRLSLNQISFEYPTRKEITELTPRSNDCNINNHVQFNVPNNFRLGQMGGYYKYNEMERILDSMYLMYPNLITPRAVIDTFKTYQGRPIYWLKMTDMNSSLPKQQILYTSLHHAREPLGLTQLIMFMWSMLENYDRDENIQDLLKKTELYFIPCINPDGYIYNEEILPNGGGNWRKNRNLVDEQANIYGVDLNRNYGLGWGYDNNGSSPNKTSSVYRGSGPFSEPETKAVKYFIENHDFKIALNYHTFSNVVVHPWGYILDTCADHRHFGTILDLYSRDNGFDYGNCQETLGYTANGDSDDWMYANENNGGIFAFTPEIGTPEEGFWPAKERIIPNSQSLIYQNMLMAQLTHGYINVHFEDVLLEGKSSNELIFNIDKVGVKSGKTSVNFEVLSNNASISNPFFEDDILMTSTIKHKLKITPSPLIQHGDKIKILMTKNINSLIIKDSIDLFYFDSLIIDKNSCDNINDFSYSGIFGIEQNDAPEGNTSLSDSPDGNYLDFLTTEAILNKSFLVPEDEEAFVSFQMKWDLQHSRDYAEVLLFVDNEGQSICLPYSTTGSVFQASGQPILSSRRNWTKMVLPLNDFAGQEIKIGFRIVSDADINRDGIKVDDIQFITTQQKSVSKSLVNNSMTLVYPNPVDDKLYIDTKFDFQQIQIFNSQGNKVFNVNQPNKVLNVESLLPGIYYMKLTDRLGQHVISKFIKG